MEEDILPVLPSYLLYTRASIVTATLLSGPLAGGYMVAENFKSLHEPKRAQLTWIVTIAALVLILGIAFLFERLPNYVLPIISTIAASRLITHFQQPDIIQHQKNGGSTFSGWRVLLIAVIGFIITLVPILTIAFLADSLLPQA